MRKIILAMLLLLPTGLAHAGASEADIRDEIHQQGYALFLADRFDELDRLADDYRINERRTGSGVWKLDKLHKAILSTVSCNCGDEAEFIAMEKRAKQWIAQNPESTTAHIVYAKALIKRGWWHRGGAFGHEVPEVSWNPFKEYIEKARLYLEERKDWLAEDPRWYVTMLEVATDQGWPKDMFYDMLKEALGRHPDYYAIYYEAIRYLSPKWHGNERLLHDLVRYAVGVTGEEEGTGLYARIYWYAADIEFGRDIIIDKPHVWERMPASMEDVLAHYPDQWNIINFARLACVAGDRDTTVRMIARIDERLVPRPWGSGEPSYKQCRDWAMGI
ncbi:MAG: hypothetical protein KAR37_17425 [Alphaproteobacteria bacterium]|nr:hypothetical protein [Alphaproteobacteria bacterium]